MKSIFSSPVLKPRVGFGGAVPTSGGFSSGVVSGGFVPSAPASGVKMSPTGVPWVIFFGSNGMTADGKWWLRCEPLPGPRTSTFTRVCGPGYTDSGRYIATPSDFAITDNNTPRWIQYFPGTGGLGDAVRAAFEDVILPAASIVIAGLGGPVGVATAALITASIKIDKGASFSHALVDATKQTISSLSDQGVFQDTYNSLVSQTGITPQKIQSYRQALGDIDAKNAFDKAVALAIGKKSQDLLIPKLRAALPVADLPWFDSVLSQGGQIKDFVAARYGNAGLAKLDSMAVVASNQAISTVGVSPNGPVAASASSSVNVGTVAAVGVGGYVTYKFFFPVLKRIFTR